MLLRHHKHPLYRRGSYKAVATDYLAAQLLVQPQHQQINHMYTEKRHTFAYQQTPSRKWSNMG